jgi:cytochrome c55X
MRRRLWLASSLLCAALARGGEPPAARQQQLDDLLRHDCGACHGMTLKGGLGPSLRPEALAGKPVDYLVATILHGRAGTAMPPWRPFLTDREAAWLARRLREGLAP